MVSLVKRHFKSTVFMLLILATAFALAACSSSSNSSNNVPLAAPTNMALTAKSGLLLIQFAYVPGIGAEGSQNKPAYEVSIGTKEDGSDKVLLGETFYDGNPVKINIVRNEADTYGDDNKTIQGYFHYDNLTDGNTYWVFIRTNFATSGYGYSNYAKISGTPIPMPQPVDNVTVTVGDHRIVVTWDEKPFEEYAVMMNDCPKGYGNLSNWTPGLSISGNNYVFTTANNTASNQICMVATNANGRGDWYIYGTIDHTAKTIAYTTVTPEAANTAPDQPVVTVENNANKRIDVSFAPVLTKSSTENKSASAYQYAYKEATSSTWSDWETILITTLQDGKMVLPVTGSNIVNGTTYDIKVRAVNTINTTGVESLPVQGTPVYTPLDFNNPTEYLSKAKSTFIYAEDIPHSDFWRIGSSAKSYYKGGRPNTDRLVRGKETALGNLYADALQWYAKEKGYNTDFAWLIGDMINTGIQQNQIITMKFLQGITNPDFIDDTVVIASVKGSDLISDLDYSIDIDNADYPPLQGSGYATTLFGQAASVYRNGHYGGSGYNTTLYNGVFWGMPSKEARYTIQYRDYTAKYLAVINKFKTKPACIAALAANNGQYDVVNDPEGCYAMTYAEANPVSGAPAEGSTLAYKRGKIKTNSLTINGVAIDPDKTYKIATTKRIADSHYLAFLKGNVQDTGVNFVRAVAEYVYNNGSAGLTPLLDGRVKLEGGVPGNNASDFTPQYPTASW